MKRTGYVLAGGRSSRMGRDKAMLPWHGATMVEHVAAEVVAAAGAAILIGDPARYGHLPYPVIPDGVTGAGPLGGIVTALRGGGGEWTLVLACDMPGVTRGFLSQLLATAAGSQADVVLPVSPRGPEPLCAAWHGTALAPLEAALAGGTRKVADALQALAVQRWAVAEIAHFTNVNTPEDWAEHAAG